MFHPEGCGRQLPTPLVWAVPSIFFPKRTILNGGKRKQLYSVETRHTMRQPGDGSQYEQC